MRTNPTAIDFSTLGLSDSNAITAVTGLTMSNQSPFATQLSAGVASGLTQFRVYQLMNNNSTSGYLGISAEL
jgi:hypothetical protein